MSRTAAQKIARARSVLIMQQPFFGTLALSLTVEQGGPQIQTMATDGRKLFYCPAFVDDLDDRELLGVVAHEVLHCANLHHTRRAGRDARLWNEACDYAINADLITFGFRLPAGALLNKRFDGMGAEAIFAALKREQAGKPAPKPGTSGAGNPAGTDPGQCGEILDAAPAHNAAATAQAEADWQARTRQAIAVAKAHAGSLPGGLARLVQTINAPRIDWREILRRFVDQSTVKDSSWSRANRRYIASGLILPGLVADRPSHIVAMVDTSGSLNTADLQAFIAELQGVLDDGAADRVTIAYADTRTHGAHEFEAGDTIKADPKGGGGTSFRQPLAWIGENVPDASAILYMTDAMCSDWGVEPSAPVLWIVSGEADRARSYAARAPFGEAIILAA